MLDYAIIEINNFSTYRIDKKALSVDNAWCIKQNRYSARVAFMSVTFFCQRLIYETIK